MQRQIMVIFLKTIGKILKVENTIFAHRAKTKGIATDLSLETMEARMMQNNIFRGLKEKNHQPKILYPVKISLRDEGESKKFLQGGKFFFRRPTLKVLLSLREFSQTQETVKETLGHRKETNNTVSKNIG